MDEEARVLVFVRSAPTIFGRCGTFPWPRFADCGCSSCPSPRRRCARHAVGTAPVCTLRGACACFASHTGRREKKNRGGEKTLTAPCAVRIGSVVSQGVVATGKFFRRKKELTDDQLNEIQDSFDLFQKDDKESGGGEARIDAEDLLVVMRALGHEPNLAELKKMVTEVDKDNTGQLDFDGYLNIILNKMAERPSTDDLHKAFRLFDPQGKRTIDFYDLKRIASQIGEQIEDEELMDMIRLADNSKGPNGEPLGEVGQEDFMKIVTSYAQHYDGER